MLNKSRKKIVSLVVAALLTIVLSGTVAQAASMPKLNKTSLTLTVGKKKKLKLSGVSAKKIAKAKWKSSKSRVATVDANGVVRAKKAGKATISVRVAKKTLKCVVTVKKADTTNKNGMSATETKIAGLIKQYIYSFNKGKGNTEFPYEYPANYVWKGGFNLQYSSVIRWVNDTKNVFLMQMSDTIFGNKAARLVKRTPGNYSTFTKKIRVGDIIITNSGRAFLVCELKRSGSTADDSIRSFGNDLYDLVDEGQTTFSSKDGIAVLFLDGGSVANYPTPINGKTVPVNLPALKNGGKQFRYADYYFFSTSSIYAYITRWPA